MDYKRADIGGVLTDIIPMEQYLDNQDVYATSNVAMVCERDGKKYVLPARKATDLRPGYYTQGSNCVAFARLPSSDCDTNYNYDDVVIDFSKEKTISKPCLLSFSIAIIGSTISNSFKDSEEPFKRFNK